MKKERVGLKKVRVDERDDISSVRRYFVEEKDLADGRKALSHIFSRLASIFRFSRPSTFKEEVGRGLGGCSLKGRAFYLSGRSAPIRKIDADQGATRSRRRPPSA